MATVFVNCEEAGHILGISGRHFNRLLSEDDRMKSLRRLEFRSSKGKALKVMFLRREIEALAQEEGRRAG